MSANLYDTDTGVNRIAHLERRQAAYGEARPSEYPTREERGTLVRADPASESWDEFSTLPHKLQLTIVARTKEVSSQEHRARPPYETVCAYQPWVDRDLTFRILSFDEAWRAEDHPFEVGVFASPDYDAALAWARENIRGVLDRSLVVFLVPDERLGEEQRKTLRRAGVRLDTAPPLFYSLPRADQQQQLQYWKPYYRSLLHLGAPTGPSVTPSAATLEEHTQIPNLTATEWDELWQALNQPDDAEDY